MEIIYKGSLNNFKTNDIDKINLSNENFYVNYKYCGKVNWEFSKLKNLYYGNKKFKTDNNSYNFTLFKGDYVIIQSTKNAIRNIDDLEFPDGRYPKLGL